jgi:hypothetical protein
VPTQQHLNSRLAQPDTQPALNEIAFRAGALSPDAQQDVLTIIRWLSAAERAALLGEVTPIPRLSREREENRS